MLRTIIYGTKQSPLWHGYTVIGLAGIGDLLTNQVAMSTAMIVAVLLGGFYAGRDLQRISVAAIACLILSTVAQLEWSAACLRGIVAILAVATWNFAKSSHITTAISTPAIDPLATAMRRTSHGKFTAPNDPASTSNLTSASIAGSADSSDFSFLSQAIALSDRDAVAKRNSGDTSTPESGAPNESGVPMIVRLLDTGVFSRTQAESIALLLSDAPNTRAGLERCVKQGMLTGLQAELIEDGGERRLRVGKYTLLSRIGRGGMGVVYRALDRERNQVVALKLFLRSQRDLMFIRREMSALNELAHPNLVTAFESGDSDGFHYIAMELVQGTNLLQQVEESGPLPEKEAIRIAFQISHALVHMHDRGVWHRDVKPSNVMKCPNGSYKLLDLGICKPSDDLNEFDSMDLQQSAVLGTAGFAPPEQIDRNLTTDASSDIYSLGGLLYFLLTGHCYVKGETTRDRFYNLLVKRRFHDLEDSGLSEPLIPILKSFLAYDQTDRCGSALEASEQLGGLLGESIRDDRKTRVSVLVVEDDPMDFEITKHMLQRTNHSIDFSHVQNFADAARALELRTDGAHEPLVVLLDLGLTDSGPEMTLDALSSWAREDVGVIAITGDDRPETRRKCLSAGASEFISKNHADSRILERAIFTAFSRLNTSTPAETLA